MEPVRIRERTRPMSHARCVWILAHTFIVFAVILALSLSPMSAQGPTAPRPKNLFSHVMKSADVDAAFARIQDSWDVYMKTNHAVTFRGAARKTGAISDAEDAQNWSVRKAAPKE